MPTVAAGSFEWDRAKAAANHRKHGVTFPEAATVLAHPTVAVFDDGTGQGRFVAVGLSHRGRMLTVVYAVRGDRERIISAWKSTRADRKRYMSGT